MTPAWHDAPTCIGLWVREYCYQETPDYSVRLILKVDDHGAWDQEAIDFKFPIDDEDLDTRWYGPIPPDQSPTEHKTGGGEL